MRFRLFCRLRNAFPRVRREILFHQMHKIGIPLICIRSIMALYSGIRGSARGPNGFAPTFLIAQGAREGCILSPLLFLIFFADAMRVLERVHLDEGAIRMGALSLVGILFADDVVLLARCISDLQLLNAFSEFCNGLHEQIALDKTEAVLFGLESCPFSLSDGKFYKNASNNDREEVKLFLKQQPVKWSSFFKYLGSPISGSEGLCFLEDSVVANITKICGALGSACRSAVALPLSRVVDLNQSLVTPIALLNFVAWVPFLKRGGRWFSSMCDHWWRLVGMSPLPGKDYYLLPWLDFGTWDLTATKMI